MKVLHVFGAMDIGGAELRTLELMHEMEPLGVEFHFLTLSGREGVLAPDIQRLGGSVHPMALGPSFAFRFVHLLRALRPRVIDSHVATFSGAIILLAWLCRVPRRIAHFRSDGDGHPNSRRRRAQRAIMKLLIRTFSTDVVGVSPSALTDGYDANWQSDPRARVVVNGVPPLSPTTENVDVRSVVGASHDDIVLIHVARPSPEKNRVMSVHILAGLLAQGVQARLVLVGGVGVDTTEIQQAAAGLGVANRVHDLGARIDARALMKSSDVLLLTSTREGLPGVVLESLSVGTPVVASALPGVRYISENVPGVFAVDLRDPVETWVAVTDSASARREDRTWRDEITAAFESSMFSLSRARDAHYALYCRPHA